MFYQLVPGCRLCQAGWRWSQQLQALRTRWQRCKLTKNGRKPNVAPQSGTKYLVQKKNPQNALQKKHRNNRISSKIPSLSKKKREAANWSVLGVSYLWSSTGGSRCFRKHSAFSPDLLAHVAPGSLVSTKLSQRILFTKEPLIFTDCSLQNFQGRRFESENFSSVPPLVESSHCGWHGMKK